MIAILDLQSVEFVTDLTLLHENNRIKVGDLGRRTRGDLSPQSPKRLTIIGPTWIHPIHSWSASMGKSQA